MPGHKHDSCVMVFARAPVAGATKTRLIPALGAEGAAELHRRLIGRALAEAIAAGIGPVELCCAPDSKHPFFIDCERRFGVALRDQAGEDLGARMHHAFVSGLAGAETALLMGSDIPAMRAHHLQQARRALTGVDAAFIPAEDGGYVLVGLARPQPRLFTGIAWGGDQVMAQTRECAAQAGLRMTELDPLWDLDRPADLARVDPVLLAGLAHTSPRQ